MYIRVAQHPNILPDNIFCYSNSLAVELQGDDLEELIIPLNFPDIVGRGFPRFSTILQKTPRGARVEQVFATFKKGSLDPVANGKVTLKEYAIAKFAP